MKNIKNNIFICFAVLLLTSCGTTGHIQFYNFSITKDVVENDLLSIINKDSVYSAPSKWNDYELGIDTVYDIFVLLHSNPKEIYQLDFVGTPSEWQNNVTCTLALVGVFDGKLWHFEKDLSSKEEERVMKRFETEILSKLKYKYTKE